MNNWYYFDRYSVQHVHLPVQLVHKLHTYTQRTQFKEFITASRLTQITISTDHKISTEAFSLEREASGHRGRQVQTISPGAPQFRVHNSKLMTSQEDIE